jgi:hypothetical protein
MYAVSIYMAALILEGIGYRPHVSRRDRHFQQMDKLLLRRARD